MMQPHSRKQPVANLVLPLVLAALLLGGCGMRNASSNPAYEGAAPAAPAAAMDAAQQASSDLQAVGGGSTTNALLNRKMVARASLALVVKDAQAAVAAMEGIMTDVGGFISDQNLYNQYSGDTPVLAGNVTLRVPAEALDETLTRLEALALQVGNRTINREDVTDQYTDLDAQLRNLRATEQELLAMLTEVRERPDAKPEDILAVFNQLTVIRGQIEQAQGQQNMLDNLIGLSTIEVSLSPDAASLPVVETGWRPAAEFRSASRSLVSGLQALGTGLIWFFVAVLPVLLLLLLPLVVLFLIARALLRRRKRRAAPATTQP